MASYEDREFGPEPRRVTVCAALNPTRLFDLLNWPTVHPASKLQLSVSYRVEEWSRMIELSTHEHRGIEPVG